MNKKDIFEKTIEKMLVKALFKKFVYGKTISLETLYLFVKNFWHNIDRGVFWHRTRKILNKYYVTISRFRKNNRLIALQKKYPDLKIIEAFFYLHLRKNFKIKNEDLEIFENTIKILLSKKIDFKEDEIEDSNKQYKLCK